jgi:hypothetical protein
MLNRILLFAGLSFSWVACAPAGAYAKDIIIVADDTIQWLSAGLPSEGGVLKVPVKVGDVLHFVFSNGPNFPHGITTENIADKPKIQKRGEADKKAFLRELGDGPSRFGPKITPTKANEEITQVQVLPDFQDTLDLMCSVHLQNMSMTLTRSD